LCFFKWAVFNKPSGFLDRFFLQQPWFEQICVLFSPNPDYLNIFRINGAFEKPLFPEFSFNPKELISPQTTDPWRGLTSGERVK